jgi:hypothetical protein
MAAALRLGCCFCCAEIGGDMPSVYNRDKIDNWVGDFCQSDALSRFTHPLREIAHEILVTFLAGACEVRDVDPEDVEEGDVKAALLGAVARLNVAEGLRREVPGLCGAFLVALQMEGRLGGGSAMGAFVSALGEAYLQASSGKSAPIVRPGSRIGRNDPCPCGSGKKYKKCCGKE